MKQAWILLAVVGLLVLAGCSSAPAPPQPGSPAFLWGAAKSSYQAGDFLKASDNLANLSKSENEFAARALPWSMVITAGIAKGYIDLAENFDAGARANRANPMPFRRQAVLFRGYASNAALQTAESLHKFLTTPAVKAPAVGLDFPYPAGSPNEPVQLQRVAKGMLFPEAEIESLQKAMMQRGVIQATAALTGSGEDAAAAAALFAKGNVQVKTEAYLLGLAKTMVDQADLFGPKQLDQPNRAKVLLGEAEEALKLVPESKQTKDLAAKIAKIRKAFKAT